MEPDRSGANTGLPWNSKFFVYGSVFAIFETVLAVVAKMAFRRSAAVAYAAANAVLALACVYAEIRPGSSVVWHFAVIGAAMLYQLLLSARDLVAPPWAVAVAVAAVALQLAFENTLIIRGTQLVITSSAAAAAPPPPPPPRPPSAAPGAMGGSEERMLPAPPELTYDTLCAHALVYKYRRVGAVPLLVWIAVPLAPGGVFAIRWWQVAVTAGLWYALAVTENRKRVCFEKIVPVPHEAAKCAVLLYLPPAAAWPLAATLSLANVAIVRWHRRRLRASARD